MLRTVRGVDDWLAARVPNAAGVRGVFPVVLAIGWWLLKACFWIFIVGVNVTLAILELAKPQQPNMDHAESTIARLISRLMPAVRKLLFLDEMDDWLHGMPAERKRAEVLSWLRNLPGMVLPSWSGPLGHRSANSTTETDAALAGVTRPPGHTVPMSGCGHPRDVYAVDIAAGEYRVSSHQTAHGCGIAVALLPAVNVVALRDAKDPTQRSLVFAGDEWQVFVNAVRNNDIPF
jgi:hypothetical protein